MDFYTLYKQAQFLKEKIKFCTFLKAYQSAEGLSLSLKNGQGKFWLNFVTKPPVASFFIDSEPLEKGDTHFSKSLNALLKGAKLVDFEQYRGERIFKWSFKRRDFSGSERIFSLIFELIGNRANLILTEGEKILDVLKKEVSDLGKRALLPGRIYITPDKKGKYLWDCKREEVMDLVLKHGIDSMIANFYPVPKFLLNEIKRRFGKGNFDSPEDVLNFWNILLHVKEELFSRIIYYDSKKGKLSPIKLNNGDIVVFDSPNEAIKTFVTQFIKEEQFKTLKSELTKTVKKSIKKAFFLLNGIDAELKKAKEKEKYRLWAEAILVNLKNIDQNSALIRIPNPYNENETLEIPYIKGKSPALVAESYFKKYSKLKKAEEHLSEKRKLLKEELSFFEDLLWQLEAAESLEDLFQIKDVVMDKPYPNHSQSVEEKKTSPYKVFKFKDVIIYVGKNSKGNDMITFKLSNKENYWFHVKDYPGAHVVAKVKRELSSDEIEKIASIAAFFSKARNSSYVDVDYTKVKFVKRSKNYRPGMVVYKNFSTVRVKPEIPKEVEYVEED